MKVIKNIDVRQAAEDANFFLWQIAEKYGLTDGNFSRLLRHELPAEKKSRILTIINELRKEA
jgi:hypothetical protein